MPNHAYGISYSNLWGYSGTDAWYFVCIPLRTSLCRSRTNGQLWMWHVPPEVVMPPESNTQPWACHFFSGLCQEVKHMLVGKYINYWQKCLLFEYLGLLLYLDSDLICVDTLVRDWKTKQNQRLIQEESFTYVSLRGISSIMEIKCLTIEWSVGKVESCKYPIHPEWRKPPGSIAGR